MNSNIPRSPYRGTEKGLVISIDFGTTFSGTSWALLDPNQVSQIRDVLGFEGQEHDANSTKVPSVLLYDKSGKLRAAGAKTLDPEIEMQAQDEEWTRVEWFKLLLRPGNLHQELENAPKTKLPRNRTDIQVIGDFYRYMAGLAHKHFMENMIGSKDIWPVVQDRVQYVLSHPNGWNTSQHARLRSAAISGGLVSNADEAQERIHFVSEGEASFHWCMNEGLSQSALRDGSRFIIVDAGGGTIDVSSYEVISHGPLQLKETAASSAHLAGSIFVTGAFQQFIEDRIAGGGSIFGDSESIKRMVQEFDQRSKRTFRSIEQKTVVAFGGAREHDRKFGIMSGRLIVDGPDMVKFFEPSCAAAEAAVRAHLSPRKKTNVMFVGGFAANPWLYDELQKRLARFGVEVFRPNSSTAKAAANGAVGFYLDHFVSARVARWTYGVPCALPFERNNAKHIMRLDDVEDDPYTGVKYISGGFATHLAKGTVVPENELTRVSFIRNVAQRKSQILNTELLCYQGEQTDIEFLNEDEEDLFRETTCIIKATIPEACLTQKRKKLGASSLPSYYWTCSYDIVVSFGTVEVKCFVEWEDTDGCVQRGPATPIWNEKWAV